MTSINGITRIAVVVLGLCAMAPNCPTCGPSNQPPNPAVVSTKALNEQQFAALPDSAMIEHRGVRMTKGEFRARRAGMAADAAAKRRALTEQSRAKFQAYRAKYLQDEQAKLHQKNAAFLNEVGRRRQILAARMTPERLALHRKAFDLVGRAKNAPPPERAQLDQRAAQILQQLGGPPPTIAGRPGAHANVR